MNKYAYAETLDVLENMDKKYFDIIPKKLIDFFKENSSKEYKKHINKDIDLKEQNLNSETIVILAMINRKYWNNI